MKRILLSLAVCVFVCFCSIVYAPSVFASIEPDTVEFTLEQTFALYGAQFDALGYTSSNGVSRVTFYYVGTSDELESLEHNSLSGNHPFRSAYAQSSVNDQMISDFNTQKYLIYACDASLINDTSHLFTVQIPYSLTISNLQFFRQRFFWTAESAAFIYASSLSGYKSKIDLYNTNEVSAYSQTSAQMQCYLPNNSTSLSGLPFFETDLTFGGGSVMKGSALDLYYFPHDSNNQRVNFDVSGMNLYLKNIKRYTTPNSISDWFGIDYQGDNQLLNLLLNKNCFFLYIAPPLVSDGFELPEPEQPEVPDYSDQIDNINNNTTQISANLASILAKLDLIYQRMGSPLSVSGTVNISSSSIDSIKGLFVPSQSSLTAWRASMGTWIQSTLNPLSSMESICDNVFSDIMNASPVGYVDLPLLDLRSAGIDFNLTATEFSDFDVVDNKVRVPLKVQDSRWNWFYELVAWGIDVICTLAFINMCIHKIHAFFVGEMVVETDDN